MHSRSQVPLESAVSMEIAVGNQPCWELQAIISHYSKLNYTLILVHYLQLSWHLKRQWIVFPPYTLFLSTVASLSENLQDKKEIYRACFNSAEQRHWVSGLMRTIKKHSVPVCQTGQVKREIWTWEHFSCRQCGPLFDHFMKEPFNLNCFI